MGYQLVNTVRNCTYLKNTTAVDSDRKCGLDVFRWVDEGETVTPKRSRYKYVYYFANIAYREQRYQHNWNAEIRRDGIVLRPWSQSFLFPKRELLTSSGYAYLNKGTYYEVISYEEELDNDGITHYINITGSCAATAPKNGSASLSFTTPSSVVAPELANLVISQDTLGRVDNVICTCGGNSAPTEFECTVTRYDNNGVASASAVLRFAADTSDPWRLEIPAAQLPLLDTVMPGNAVHIKLKALNSAGSSEDSEFTVYAGSAACQTVRGDFKNATPYVKYNGVWVPAITYVDYEELWTLTKQGVELDYGILE